MSEDTAVARVEAWLIGQRVDTRNGFADLHLVEHVAELIAAARAWEAHTCGEARRSPRCECGHTQAHHESGSCEIALCWCRSARP